MIKRESYTQIKELNEQLIFEFEAEYPEFAIDLPGISQDDLDELIMLSIENDSPSLFFRQAVHGLLTTQQEHLLSELSNAGSADQQTEQADGELKQLDESSIAQLMLARFNLKFVTSIAKYYARKTRMLSLADLIQEGNVGLMRAAQRFDDKKGYYFTSFAKWWVKNEILAALREKTRLVKLRYTDALDLSKVRTEIKKFAKELHRQPSIKELSEHIGFSEERIEELINLDILTRPLWLDAPYIYLDGEEKTLARSIAANDPESQVESYVRSKMEQEKIIELVKNILGNYPDYFEVINRHYLQPESETLKDIADEKGVTREAMRQKKESGLKKLRANSELQAIWEDLEEYNDNNIGDRTFPTSELTDAIFSLPKRPEVSLGKIFYAFIQGKTVLDIAQKFQLEEETVEKYICESALLLWERLPMRQYWSSKEVRDALYYYPFLRLNELQQQFLKVYREIQDSNLSDEKLKTLEIFETFFGFSSQTGLFNMYEVAKKFNGMERADIKQQLIDGLKQFWFPQRED